MENLVVVKQQVAVIEWNKEKALKEAQEIMAKYEGTVFQEEDLAVAKKEIATLRKVSKEINAQALAIDKELTEPVKQFRNDVKEVKAIVDNGIDYINEQVQEFELKLAKEREEEIRSWQEWNDIEEFSTFNPDWLLKKWVDKLLVAEFLDIKNSIESAIATIKLTCNTFKLDSDNYIEKLKTMSLEQVVGRMNEDYKLINTNVEEAPVVIRVKENDPIYTITRELKGTTAQFIALKEYAIKIGVEWIK